MGQPSQKGQPLAANKALAKSLSANAVEAAAKKPVSTAVEATAIAEGPVAPFVRSAAILRANMRQDPMAAKAMEILSKPAAEQATLRAAAAAGKASAITDKAAAHAVPQEADNKAAAVTATSHQPDAQSTAKNTAAHAAPKALEESAKTAHTATADQAKRQQARKPLLANQLGRLQLAIQLLPQSPNQSQQKLLRKLQQGPLRWRPQQLQLKCPVKLQLGPALLNGLPL